MFQPINNINALGSSAMNNGYGMGYGMGHGDPMNQMQSILQMQLVKNLSSGNFVIDTICQVFIMTIVTYFISKMKSLNSDDTGTVLQYPAFVSLNSLILKL